MHRRTVRVALSSAVPTPRKVPVRVAPKLEAAKLLLDGMLVEDLTASRKQQHTARRELAPSAPPARLSRDPPSIPNVSSDVQEAFPSMAYRHRQESCPNRRPLPHAARSKGSCRSSCELSSLTPVRPTTSHSVRFQRPSRGRRTNCSSKYGRSHSIRERSPPLTMPKSLGTSLAGTALE